MIQVVAFRWVPPFAQGFVRDLRVRWALEEAGLAYDARLIGPDDQASTAYRQEQPFGQVPAYVDDTVALFESGAIVLHIAEQSEALMPRDPAGRARTMTWVFAALNSMEPHIQNFGELNAFFGNEAWAKLRRPSAEAMVQSRLDSLSKWLGDKDYLEDRFTAGDLLMSTVLRILEGSDLMADTPNLVAYRARCEARPAFQKALADHLEPFQSAAAPA
jgi:glutathione S-transferase